MSPRMIILSFGGSLMNKRHSLIAMATILIGSSLPHFAHADSYCNELLASKIVLQKQINKNRDKVRLAKTPEARELYMNKFEDAYSRHSVVDHEFTRECR